jgi:lactate dehydrogenase-like 2-hydroxyacid dehydrogenase
MARPKVIVTRRWPESVEAELQRHFDVALNGEDVPFTREQLAQAFAGADAVFPTVTDRIDAAILSAGPVRARLIGNFGVGYNHIDVAAAKAKGLVVTNTPEVLTDATADLAMALLFAVARRVGEGERHVRAGAWTGWRPTHMVGTQITGKTLGLIGFGRIGRAVARKAHRGFDMKILAHDPFPPDAATLSEHGAAMAESIDEVLAEADFISLHCPATPENRHLIDAARLTRMRRDAYLVNTARGDIVDEAALAAALRAGTIAGAALDVHEFEPKVSTELAAMENVVLLPHLGSATKETRDAMGMRVLENALAFFAGREPRDRIA